MGALYPADARKRTATTRQYEAVLLAGDRTVLERKTFEAEGPFAAIAKGMDYMRLQSAAECYELWRGGKLIDYFSPDTGNNFGSSTSVRHAWVTPATAGRALKSAT
jgi:hypothetical protein